MNQIRNLLTQLFLATLLVCFGLNVLAETTTANIKPITSGFIPVTGGKIYYQTFGAGEPMIVLHGGPGLDQSYLMPQMLELAKDNKVTFYDQRGSGKSLDFKLSADTVNFPIFVADLEAVRKHLGYKKFVLVGHSWGGWLAMQYSIKYPQHVAAMILIDSAPVNSLGMKIFLNEANKRLEPQNQKIKQIEQSDQFKEFAPQAVAEYYKTIFSVYFYDPKKLDQLTLHFSPGSAKDGLEVAKLLGPEFSADYDLIADLQKLNIPTLIVHGEYDVVPLETAKDSNKAIPNSKLVVVTESDHFPYIEQPQQTFAAIHDFLKSLQ